MWANLTDDVRKAIADAGDPPTGLRSLDDSPEHKELFFQYFADNCSDGPTWSLWSCYWWLADKDLNQASGGYSRSRGRSVDAEQFWEGFGPNGASPIAWPAEIVDWFAQAEAWDDAIAAAYDPAWDAECDDDPGGPEFEAYRELVDGRWTWLQENPTPLRAALAFAEETVKGWYKAYVDEVSRMEGLAMTIGDLDLDYIDTLNKYNLDQLAVDEGLPCVGYGPYVLIGEFPPGYTNAVASYDKSWWGTVTMTAKGSRFNPGTVTVTGCEGDNQRWFKEAFRRVSKKAVKYE
jgi:hypothetical protein